jgi:uncharacterized RDD family membrane protein YckC
VVNEDESNYDVLGVASNASKDQIRDAYREQLSEAQAGVTREETAKRPSGSSIAAARAEEARIRAAWQVLSDPMQRERYDAAHGIDNTGTDVELVDDDEGDDDQGDDDQDGTPVSRRPARRNVPPVFLDGHELAPSGRRATAALIDIVIVGLAGAAIIAIGAIVETKANKNTVQGIVTAVALAVLLAYFVLPTTISGQTFGKRLTHIVVVDRETGNLPRISRVLTRYAIPIVALLLLGFFGALLAIMAGLSFLMAKDLLSLGDRVGKTIVIVARYKPQRTSF